MKWQIHVKQKFQFAGLPSKPNSPVSVHEIYVVGCRPETDSPSWQFKSTSLNPTQTGSNVYKVNQTCNEAE